MRLYLVGAGVIARYHAAAVSKLPDPGSVSLFVADPNPAARDEFCRQFPAAHACANAREMLSAPAQEDDIVVIATPPFTHYALACDALASGRHTLCEKPLAMSITEARRMLDAARSSGRLLGCCSTRFLGLPTNTEVKRLLKEDALGKLYHVTFVNRDKCVRAGIEFQPSSRFFIDRARNGGGILMDWGPYDFSALNDVLHPVRVDVLSAWLANPEVDGVPEGVVFDVEEHGGASMRYHLAGGATFTLNYERAACTHGEPRSIAEIEGSRGAVNWDWLMLGPQGHVTRTWAVPNGAERQATTFTADKSLEEHDKPLVYFYQRVRGLDSPAVVNEQAVFNFSCFRAIFDCAETGQPQSVSLDGA